MQQRYVLTVTLFIGITIAFAERSVLSMAITRMVEIPNQNVTTPSKIEPICEAPEWAVNTTGGTTVVDQAVKILKPSFTHSNIEYFVFLLHLCSSSNMELNIIGHSSSKALFCPRFLLVRKSHSIRTREIFSYFLIVRIYSNTLTGWITSAKFRRQICTWTRYHHFSIMFHGYPSRC